VSFLRYSASNYGLPLKYGLGVIRGLVTQNAPFEFDTTSYESAIVCLAGSKNSSFHITLAIDLYSSIHKMR